jgi:hypothetical protein
MNIEIHQAKGAPRAQAFSLADSLRNLRTADFKLGEGLNPSERRWLVSRLLERKGVASVRYSPESPTLHIEYDGERTNALKLVDFLRLCGVVPAVVLRHD